MAPFKLPPAAFSKISIFLYFFIISLLTSINDFFESISQEKPLAVPPLELISSATFLALLKSLLKIIILTP